MREALGKPSIDRLFQFRNDVLECLRRMFQVRKFLRKKRIPLHGLVIFFDDRIAATHSRLFDLYLETLDLAASFPLLPPLFRKRAFGYLMRVPFLERESQKRDTFAHFFFKTTFLFAHMLFLGAERHHFRLRFPQLRLELHFFALGSKGNFARFRDLCAYLFRFSGESHLLCFSFRKGTSQSLDILSCLFVRDGCRSRKPFDERLYASAQLRKERAYAGDIALFFGPFDGFRNLPYELAHMGRRNKMFDSDRCRFRRAFGAPQFANDLLAPASRIAELILKLLQLLEKRR